MRSGYYDWYSGDLGGRSIAGYYWSSRAYSATGSRSLGFYFTLVHPRYNYGKSDGFAVRCVAREEK